MAYFHEMAYFQWCVGQLDQKVRDDCSSLATADAQLACGESIVQEYKTFLIRMGPYKCGSLAAGSEGLMECLSTANTDTEKAFIAIYEAWGKVRAGGDAASEVVTALKDTVTCLEDLGHENVDAELLFGWQRFENPADQKERESARTQDQKGLIATLHEPSRDCAKKNGLFTAQDTAWIAELERLDREEPETVEVLIQEGLLEVLKKPGVETFLTADRPS